MSSDLQRMLVFSSTHLFNALPKMLYGDKNSLLNDRLNAKSEQKSGQSDDED